MRPLFYFDDALANSFFKDENSDLLSSNPESSGGWLSFLLSTVQTKLRYKRLNSPTSAILCSVC